MFVNNERVHFLNTPSHDSCLHIPYDILSLSNFSGPIPFVSRSASISSVGQYLRLIVPLAICLFPNEMILNVDMFCSSVELRVLCH